MKASNKRLAWPSLLLAAGLLCGCAGGTQAPQGPDTPPVRQQLAAPPTQAVELRVFLPAGQTALATALQRLAAADGNTLNVQTTVTGSLYPSTLEAALLGDEAPDLFWLETDEEATQLQTYTANLLQEGQGPLVQALAALVPGAARLVQEEAVYGLPVGWFAQGYLVNIELLAALLGTQNQGQLLRDLQACSYAEWEQMMRTIENYLARPAAMQVQLAGAAYTMPVVRPAAAQPLRGIFATPTGNAAALCGNALDALYALCLAEYPALAQADSQQKAAWLHPALTSLLGLLELETTHMTQKNGTLRRGEGYSEQPTISTQEAAALFAEGTALFYRADSREGHTLEAEYPALEGRLALVPIKLPAPTQPPEEDAPPWAGTDDAPQTDDDSGENDEEEQPTAPEVDPDTDPDTILQRLEAAVAQSNRRLWYASDGYLCLNANAQQMYVAQSLLLRLYTTQEGQAALADEVALQPFSQAYPAALLMQCVLQPATAGQAPLPFGQGANTAAQTQIGTHLQQQMMDTYTWSEEQRIEFLHDALSAMGASLAQEGPPEGDLD